MALLSLAWWTQKLSGIAVQAMAVVLGVALLVGGLAWLRHDARADERLQCRMAASLASNKALVLLRRREREATAVGARAEKNLLEELDALTTLNSNLETKLASRPTRVICYPKDVVRELNR